MIQARFTIQEENITGFSVAGHALFADSGSDIVCAAVSAAVELSINGITEVLSVPAQVSVQEDRICFSMKQNSQQAQAFLRALQMELEQIQRDYPKCITVTEVE